MSCLYTPPAITSHHRKFAEAHRERLDRLHPVAVPTPRMRIERVTRGKFRIETEDDLARLRLIVKAVLHFYPGVTEEEIKGDSRYHTHLEPRWVCFYLLTHHTRLSSVAIGRMFGGRHHTTVLSAIERMNELLPTAEKLRAQIARIKSALGVEE